MAANHEPGVYFFGRKWGEGKDIPIVDNAKELTGKIVTVGTTAIDAGTTVLKVITTAGQTSADTAGFIRSNWKLLSVGGVALIVLLKK